VVAVGATVVLIARRRRLAQREAVNKGSWAVRSEQATD
jgi:hypothetical protein